MTGVSCDLCRLSHVTRCLVSASFCLITERKRRKLEAARDLTWRRQ